MKRRDFLKWQATGAAILTGAAAGLPIPVLATEPDIGVANGAPGPAVRAAVGLVGGMDRFVRPGDKVVIKPNMSFDQPPEMATNTHPEVVQTLAAMCWEAKAAEVLVLDNPLRSSERCLERSGIQEACAYVRDDMVHALQDSSFYFEDEIPQAEQMTRNRFLKDVLDADVLIAAPVAKSHSGAGVSLSLKGMMGLIKDRGVMHSRYDLATAIVDLNLKLKADLAVIDATRVLTTNGPGGPGEVDIRNMVVASADPVAADAYTVANCQWWGRTMKPSQVPHLLEAHKRGLGSIDLDSMIIKSVAV